MIWRIRETRASRMLPVLVHTLSWLRSHTPGQERWDTRIDAVRLAKLAPCLRTDTHVATIGRNQYASGVSDRRNDSRLKSSGRPQDRARDTALFKASHEEGVFSRILGHTPTPATGQERDIQAALRDIDAQNSCPSAMASLLWREAMSVQPCRVRNMSPPLCRCVTIR
jgi:hypothetical protein